MSTYLSKKSLSFEINNVNLTIKKIYLSLGKVIYKRCLFHFPKINQVFNKIYPSLGSVNYKCFYLVFKILIKLSKKPSFS